MEANGKFVGEIKCLEEFLSQHSSLFSLMIFAGNDGDDKLDKISVYFNEASNYNYVPRSVMVDLVRKVVKSIITFSKVCGNGNLMVIAVT